MIFTLLISMFPATSFAQNRMTDISNLVKCEQFQHQYVRKGKPFISHCTIDNSTGAPLLIESLKSDFCKIKKGLASAQPILQNTIRTVEVECNFTTPGYVNKEMMFTFQGAKGSHLYGMSSVSGEVPEHDGCGEVRLDTPGGSFHEVASLQQKMPDCQTQTATALYDAFRFGHSRTDMRQSSPGSMFLELCSKEVISFGEDYDTGRVLEYLRSNRPCALKEENLVSGNATKTGKVREEKVESLSEDIERISDNFSYSSAAKVRRTIDSCTKKYRLPIDYDKLQILTESINDLSSMKDLSLFVKTDCPDKDRVSAPPDFIVQGREKVVSQKMETLGEAPNDWQKAQGRRIHQCLDRDREKCQPFGMQFCSSVLLPEFKKGLSLNFCNGHAAVLIGRRYKNNRCEFLIRNSSPLSGMKPNGSWEPESGNDFWISESSMMAATNSALHLEESKK